MNPSISFESLVERVEAIERAIGIGPAKSPRPKDWRRTIGMFGDSSFMREVDDECLRAREAERAAAQTDEQAP